MDMVNESSDRDSRGYRAIINGGALDLLVKGEDVGRESLHEESTLRGILSAIDVVIMWS